MGGGGGGGGRGGGVGGGGWEVWGGAVGLRKKRVGEKGGEMTWVGG